MIVITTSNSMSVNPHRVSRPSFARWPICPALPAFRHSSHCWTSQQWHPTRLCLEWASLEAFMMTLPLFSAAPRRPLTQTTLDQA